MESANRDEAKKCLRKAKSALKSGAKEEAERFASKSLRLCYSKEAEDFLNELSNVSSSTSSSGADKSGRQNATEKIYQQTNSQRNAAAGDKDYTEEQNTAVQRVLHCKDYYDILGVSRDASDVDLKKHYKRLALTLHPDKNRAPQADEAFKAVSKAYSVLSDATRRNHYDRYGEDGLRGPNAAADPDLSPDDLFRMFFGENFGFGSEAFVYTSGRNVFGTSFNSNHHRFRGFGDHQHRHHHQRHHHSREGSNFMYLCQVLPIMLILLVSLSSSLLQSLFAESPPYSLRRSGEYNVKRVTSEYSVPYYVNPSFESDYKNSIRNIERAVLEEYVYELRVQCNTDIYRRRGSQSKACEKLKKMKTRTH